MRRHPADEVAPSQRGGTQPMRWHLAKQVAPECEGPKNGVNAAPVRKPVTCGCARGGLVPVALFR